MKKTENQIKMKITAIFLSLSSLLMAGGNIVPVEPTPVVEEEEINFSQQQPQEEIQGDSSIGVFVGTTGVGATYSKKMKMGANPKGVIKFSASGLTGLSPEYEDDVANYETDINLLNMGVTFDYHPFNNGFYLSGGGFYNGNKAKFKISPKNGKLTVNGHEYSTDELGYLEGETNFKAFVPYVGVGYDNSLFGSGNWFFTAKAGVIYQGSPNITLDYHCGNDATNEICHQIKSDASEAEFLLNSDLDDYKIYPDLAVGISYRF